MATFLSINNFEVSVKTDAADYERMAAAGSEQRALDGTML